MQPDSLRQAMVAFIIPDTRRHRAYLNFRSELLTQASRSVASLLKRIIMSRPVADKAAIEASWEFHKLTIQRLYLVEKKTLEGVRDLMRKFYNFNATYILHMGAFREFD
jgi:Clr5 domain